MSIRKCTITLAVTIVFTLMTILKTNADIVVKGSFELGSSGNFTQGQVIGGGSLPGWVVDIIPGSNPQNHNVDLTAGGGYWNHFDGQRSLDLEGSWNPGGSVVPGGLSASISQVHATTIGQEYELSFAMGGNYFENWTQPRQMEVLWNNNSLGIFQHSLAPGESWNNFTWDVHRITLSSATILGNDKLTFRSITPAVDGFGAVLDAVSVTAVPEPSALILLSAASLSSMLIRRRRKT